MERERLWTEALEGLRESQGKASPEIWVTSRDLAFVLINSGKTEEGIRLLRRAVSDFRDKYGESNPWTTGNMEHLARGLRMVGKSEEAIEVSRDFFRIRLQLAEDPEADADSLNGLAWDLLTWNPPELQDPATALPLAERAVKLSEESDLASPLDTLALALHRNGRNAEAADAQRRALSLAPTNDPDSRSEYVVRLVKYLDATVGSDEEIHAVVVDQVGRLEEASDSADAFVLDVGGFSNQLADEQLHETSTLALREALVVAHTRWDSDPVATADLHYRIGRALLHQGRARDAEEVLRDGVALAREAGSNDFLTRNQVNLAEALAHQGRNREVQVIATEVLRRYNEGSDQNIGYTRYQRGLQMDSKRHLGVAALGLNDLSTAEPLLLEAAQWSERNLPPDSWRRARAASAWGECLTAMGRYDEAEPILLESQTVLETELGTQATATLDTARRLERLYESRGNRAEAAKWAEAGR